MMPDDQDEVWTIPVYILRKRIRHHSLTDEEGWKIVCYSRDLDKITELYNRELDYPGWDIIEILVPIDGTIMNGRESLIHGKGWEGYV